MSARGGYPLVEVLWTGGYDSTFRVVQLSRLAVRIQPYYVSDDRKSEEYELSAIRNITEALKKHSETKCEFLPLKTIGFSERRQSKKIEDTYNELRKETFFGTQYNWLASFAEEHKGIELSIHQDDKAIELINKYGALTKMEDKITGEYYVVDENKTDPRVVTLFQNYHLPLVKWTKRQMKEYYINNGYGQIMDMTWFCHKPINGKPCGICNPCVYTIEEGLKERFTKRALARYYCRKAAKKTGIIKIVRKLKGH